MNARASISERDQIAQLQEEVLWLKAELGLLMDAELVADLREIFGLAPMEAKMLLILVNSKLVTKEIAMHGLADAGYDYDALEKIIDVYVCKLRKKLKRAGIGITTIWATGYRLEQDGRRRLAEIMGWPVSP